MYLGVLKQSTCQYISYTITASWSNSMYQQQQQHSAHGLLSARLPPPAGNVAQLEGGPVRVPTKSETALMAVRVCCLLCFGRLGFRAGREPLTCGVRCSPDIC